MQWNIRFTELLWLKGQETKKSHEPLSQHLQTATSALPFTCLALASSQSLVTAAHHRCPSIGNRFVPTQPYNHIFHFQYNTQ